MRRFSVIGTRHVGQDAVRGAHCSQTTTCMQLRKTMSRGRSMVCNLTVRGIGTRRLGGDEPPRDFGLDGRDRARERGAELSLAEQWQI